MTDMDKKILCRFKSLLQEKVNVDKVVLFGSRARNTSCDDSDMDVLVVVDEKPTSTIRDFISDSAWEAGFEANIVVVPIIFSRDEWERGPESGSMLHRAVESEGIFI